MIVNISAKSDNMGVGGICGQLDNANLYINNMQMIKVVISNTITTGNLQFGGMVG